MIPHWQWLFRQLTRHLWFRAALLAALGVAAALLALALRGFIPDDFPGSIAADAVDGILNILASSMLAVTTFSLSVMVVAFGRATEHATPRASRLLAEDQTSQNALSTFIGAFLFALVGLIALNAGVYGGSGRIVLFAATIVVIILIVVALVRWIDHLTRFGQLDETTARVENAAGEALQLYADRPCLGGRPLEPEMLGQALNSVWPESVGYVLYVDVAQLAKISDELGRDLYVVAPPGSFVHYRSPLVRLAGEIDDRQASRLRRAFQVGTERSFAQDPIFGLTVLSEIASRALSPGINDPGTAIDVIGRVERLLLDYDRARAGGDDDPAFGRLFVPTLSLKDAFNCVYNPIARDGAGLAEVQLRLQTSLAALAESGNPEFIALATLHSTLALERATAAGMSQPDLEALRAAAFAAAT